MNSASALFAVVPLIEPLIDMVVQKKTPKEKGFFIEKRKATIKGEEVWLVIDTSSYVTEEEADRHIQIQEMMRNLTKTVNNG